MLDRPLRIVGSAGVSDQSGAAENADKRENHHAEEFAANVRKRVERNLTAFGRGEVAATTEFKALSEAPGQRLAMLTFPAERAETDVRLVVDQLPFDVVVMNRDLCVTYASSGAARTAGLEGGEIIGRSALSIAPTSGWRVGDRIGGKRSPRRAVFLQHRSRPC